jgi:hypothetical protein
MIKILNFLHTEEGFFKNEIKFTRSRTNFFLIFFIFYTEIGSLIAQDMCTEQKSPWKTWQLD